MKMPAVQPGLPALPGRHRVHRRSRWRRAVVGVDRSRRM